MEIFMMVSTAILVVLIIVGLVILFLKIMDKCYQIAKLMDEYSDLKDRVTALENREKYINKK